MFIACVNRSWQPPALPENVHLVRTDDLRGRLAHAAWDQWGISRVAARERADVLVSLLNFGPARPRIPHIVFERNPVYFCDYYLRGLHGRRALEIKATRALAHAVMRGARRVVTPSAAMRDMIRAFYPDLPPERFRVVPHGFGLDAFRTKAPLPERAADAIAGSEGVKLLYVSHAASYKGVEILLEAARALRYVGVPSTTWLTVAKRRLARGVSEVRSVHCRAPARRSGPPARADSARQPCTGCMRRRICSFTRRCANRFHFHSSRRWRAVFRSSPRTGR